MTTATNINVDASRIDSPGLDPITVITHDISPGEGTLIVECYGSAWSAWWGGMSGKTVSQFVATVGVDYLEGCLSRPNTKQTSIEKQWLRRISQAVIDHFTQQ